MAVSQTVTKHTDYMCATLNVLQTCSLSNSERSMENAPPPVAAGEPPVAAGAVDDGRCSSSISSHVT